MVILQSKEVQGVLHPITITAAVIAITMGAGAVVDTLDTFPRITSDGTSYGTEMCLGVRQET